MITSQDFDRTIFKPPRLKDDRPMIDNLVGIDSEAYITGVPFILATSRSDVFDPVNVPECFFDDSSYHNVNFVVWNLKYDSGAILYYLDRDKMQALWETNKVSLFRPDRSLYKFEYIPHKLLRISKGRTKISFWDISQFFKTSLDQAAQTYLHESKTKMQTKNFTPEYFKRNKKSVINYCIRDAQLTQKLSQFAVDKFAEFGIVTPSLYSCASVSFKYFCDHTKVVSVYPFWKKDKKVLAYAADSYEGGKFEITTKGKFHGYEYDLSSAYPYEIANLIDISRAYYEFTTTADPDSTYSFLRCRIENHSTHLPCGPMVNNIRIFPSGHFFLTITKAEYEYLIEQHVKVEIISALHLYVKRNRYPYKKAIADLFKIKASYKGKDPMSYTNAKIVLNSFYGKMAQSIETPEGKVHLGAGWNPFYASVITANNRLKVTKIQNILKDDCLAVHTDSVITKTPLPKSIPLNGLGKFEYVTEGDGILIACGMYQIGDTSAFKGFKSRSGETWESLLSRYPNRKTVPYKILHVESWVESMAKNHLQNRINVFEKTKKLMDLNCDRKRIWERSFKARDFLESQQNSVHRIYIENDPPKYW